MPELRIILLIAGVLFIAGIVGFEWWRSRKQRPAAVAPAHSQEDTSEQPPGRAAPVSLPEINVVREARVPVADSLPVIEIRQSAREPSRDTPGIAVSSEVAVDHPFETTSTQAILRSHDEPYIGQDDEVSAPRIVEAPPQFDDMPAAGGPRLTLAWPKEDERRIVTLRVMPRSEPRFPGRALRQAFGGAGFWHGPLDIYHLPDEQGRVILSAAALAHPGTFDPSIMDSQRFSGLNMFAVLPGPLPERDAFEELVRAARTLAERLDGKITDQHGEELTAQRIARLRQSFEAPVARASGEA